MAALPPEQLRAAIEAARQKVSTTRHPKLLGWLAGLLMRQARLEQFAGRYENASRLLQEVLPLYEELKDERSRALALGRIADLHHLRQEREKALHLRREVVRVFKRLGDEREHAIALGRVADSLQDLGGIGQLQEALRIRTEVVIPAFERLGDERERAVALGRIADLRESPFNDLDEALRIRREELLPVYERLGDQHSRAAVLGKIAGTLAARGQLDEAQRLLLEEVLPVLERLNDVRGVLASRASLAQIYLARGGKVTRGRGLALLRDALGTAERLQLAEAWGLRYLLDRALAEPGDG